MSLIRSYPQRRNERGHDLVFGLAFYALGIGLGGVVGMHGVRDLWIFTGGAIAALGLTYLIRAAWPTTHKGKRAE